MAVQLDLLHNLPDAGAVAGPTTDATPHATLDTTPDAGTAPVTTPDTAMPHPLQPGERVELWLALPPESETAAATDPDDQGAPDDWDVRPARVSGTSVFALEATLGATSGAASGAASVDTSEDGALIAVYSGSWQLAGAPGTRAIIRRLGADGIAEWHGTVVVTPEPATTRRALGLDDPAASGYEVPVVVRATPDEARGILYQRRRSPRLAVRLTPIRLIPLPQPERDAAAPHATAATGMATAEATVDDDPSLSPVARLMDVSAHGAAVVVDTPLSTGTTVALEFELPGETEPFAVRGRVVEPAVALHGDVQPQLDGLPGFRRGVEFVGSATNRHTRRLTSTLTRLLQRRPS